MTPPWGINWLKYHQDMHDMPHIEKMGYASFTIFEWMWNNRDFCNELLSVARKDAIFLDRDHPMSEQKDDQWKNDPAGKGRNHADDWAQKVKDGKVFTPIDRTYFLGLNEPNSNQFQRQIDAYNEAFCRRMAQHGLRVAAYSFGVGHPSTVNLDPKLPPDWHWYEASAAAILEGGHIVATHEYGVPENYGWGYWCGRIAYCPHPFTVVFDECGIDHGVVDGNLYGYQMYMKPLGAYCNWLDGFQIGQAERAPTYKVKVHSYNIFCYDFGRSDAKDWASYDIRPIRPDLEAFQWTVVAAPTTPDTPPFQVLIPSAGTGTVIAPKTMYVAVTNGARIRSYAPDGDTVSIARYGEPVTILADTVVAGGDIWQRVAYKGTEGYMLASLLSATAPAPTQPEPVQPSGDKWQRTIAFILKEEGGYTANDEGNPANFGINQGANPDLNVKDITREQAIERYRTGYWIASGANNLDWPFCLLVMDAAVQHGAGEARMLLKASKGDPWHFQGARQLYYANIEQGNWNRNGKAWMARMGRLLVEASKP